MAQKVEFRLHVKGPDSAQDFVLPIGRAILGRDPSCELLLAYPLVSRRHAQFTISESECEIVDLGSANGTSVNGVKLTPQVPVSLPGGALITIGPFEIQVEAMSLETQEAAGPPAVEKSQLAVEKPQPAVEKSQLTVEEAQPAVEKPQPAAEKPEPDRLAAKQAKVPAKPAKKPEKPAEEKGSGHEAGSPPPKPPQPAVEMRQPGGPQGTPAGESLPALHSLRLLNYLPGIYQTDFMSRFLAMFESILIPIEWNVDHFDMYLDPGTAPLGFLPWLANWYTIIFDSTWSESQRRTLLKEAHQIYARRGTRWALSRVLEIYLGQKPEISEFTNEKEPFTFLVNLPMSQKAVNQELVEAIIDSSKPAHTSYRLTFK